MPLEGIINLIKPPCKSFTYSAEDLLPVNDCVTHNNLVPLPPASAPDGCCFNEDNIHIQKCLEDFVL